MTDILTPAEAREPRVDRARESTEQAEPVVRPADPSSRGSARRSARWRLVLCIAIVVAALGWIAARGLTGSFVYYLTPTDVRVHHQAQVDQRVRLGGDVVPGTGPPPAGTPSLRATPRGTRKAGRRPGPPPQGVRAGQGGGRAGGPA